MRLTVEMDRARAGPLHIRPRLELRRRRPIGRPVPVANPRAPCEPLAAATATSAASAGRQPASTAPARWSKAAPAATSAATPASAAPATSATPASATPASATPISTSTSTSARRRELRQRAVPVSEAGQPRHQLGGAVLRQPGQSGPARPRPQLARDRLEAEPCGRQSLVLAGRHLRRKRPLAHRLRWNHPVGADRRRRLQRHISRRGDARPLGRGVRRDGLQHVQEQRAALDAADESELHEDRGRPELVALDRRSRRLGGRPLSADFGRPLAT